MADWKNKLPEIQNRLRFQLFSRKIDGIDPLFGFFRNADADNSGTLNRYEFDDFLSQVGMFVTTQETTELFRYYDQNGDGQVNMEEFLSGVQGDMSEKRLAVVKHAFQHLDSAGTGQLDLARLLRQYDELRHPRVTTREKPAAQVRDEIESVLPRYSQNGVISEDAFLAYYLNISACVPIEQEEYFTTILVNTWGIPVHDPSRLEAIENTLYEKVRQRCKPSEDEGRSLARQFQHFDTNENGAISFNEFCRALENYGCTFLEKDLVALFRKYDADNSGFLCYEEFTNAFAARGAGAGSQFPTTKTPPNPVLDKVRKDLLKRGAHGIRGLGIVFRRMDDNGDKHLDKYEFEWGMRESGHALGPMDMERLFKYFDKNRDGRISYDEFLVAIRGDMNDRRTDLVKLAYEKLDKNGDQTVNLEDMRIAYDVSFHPDFNSGKKSADQILQEFMGQWDTINRDGIVTLEEFCDYYKDVSASIDRDDEFELMIRNAWHISGGEGWCENTSIPRELQIGPDGKQRVVMAAGHEDFKYEPGMSKGWGGEI